MTRSSPRFELPSNFLDVQKKRQFTHEEEEQKRLFYDKMSPRRRKFIDRIGYDVWDPFEGPKEPMDIRTDVTKHTTQELIRKFLQTVAHEKVGNEYARGALECALGLVSKEEKYRGILDFCVWYSSLLVSGTGKKMKERYDDLDEYIDDLRATISKTPDCANHLYNLGVALLAKRDFPGAERSFLDAVRKAPRLAEAYVQLGGICLQRDDLDGCLNYNKEAANCRPRFSIAWGNIGFVHLQRGEPDEAIPAFKKAIKWDPNFVQAIASLAAAHFMKGELEESIAFSEQAIKQHAQFGPAYNNLALAWLEKGDAQKALEYARLAEQNGFDVPQALWDDLRAAGLSV